MANGSQRALLPSSVERGARSAARHDRGEPGTASGFLRLRYRAAGPLHVGTGALALWPAGAVPAAATAFPARETALIAGRPGLPGSTLRGALRQRYARMTRSCVGWAGSESLPRGQRPSHAALDFCRGRELCPACSLFGVRGFRGRVRVSDALTPEGTEVSLASLPSSGPRGRGGGGRGQGPRGASPAHGGAQWVEVIAPETELHVELGVRNLRAEELGGLLGALGCEPLTALVCGAGRSAGFGRLFAEGLEVELYRPDGAVEDADVASWRKAFEECPDRWPAGEAALLQELGD